MTRRIMRAFKLDEISAVDRPAQAHAKVVLMKRDFSASERRTDAKSGVALPDGSFPIANAEDLANARRLAGKAKDPAAARAHIASRAKALGLSKLESTMTDEEIQKAVEAAVAEAKIEFDALKKRADDAEAALAKAKDGKDGEPDGDEGKDGDGKDGKGKMKKLELPEEIRKKLEKADANEVILKQLMDEREAAIFAKRAVAIGLQEPHGEILRKAYTGDKESIAKLEALMKGLAEQVRTGKIFAEFGSNQSGGGATAADEMNAQAAAYREGQLKIGKKCSPEQAFTAVYTDSAHAELKKRYDTEEMKKRYAA
jgi:hypothetical protein